MDKKARLKKIFANSCVALCSVFIPGLGHLLKSQWRWIIILCLIPSLLNLSIEWWHGYDSFIVTIIVTLLGFGLWGFTIVHAYLVPFRSGSKWLITPLFFIVIGVNGYIQDRNIFGEFPFIYGVLDEEDLTHNASPLQQGELILFRRLTGNNEEGQHWVFEREKRKFSLGEKSDSRLIPHAKPLYIFWSSDFSRIGKSLDELSSVQSD